MLQVKLYRKISFIQIVKENYLIEILLYYLYSLLYLKILLNYHSF